MTVDRWCVMAGDLTDEEGARLEPLLPSVLPQRGGHWCDHQRVINWILWRVENGAKWQEVPDRYGPGKTCYDRFSRWEQDGTWAKIERQLQTDASTPTPPEIWTGTRRSIPASCGCTSTLRAPVKGGSLRPSRMQRKESAVPGAA